VQQNFVSKHCTQSGAIMALRTGDTIGLKMSKELIAYQLSRLSVCVYVSSQNY